jgi:GT2 family glycosyltransferase
MIDIKIAVCILFYEKVEQTIECISSFLSSGVSIYVLNNGSSQPAINILREFCALHGQIKIIDLALNLGIGVGRNRLITETREEWLFFVDNDITMKTHDWLDRIKQHIKINDSVEAFIPRQYNVHENRYAIFDTLTLIKGRVGYKETTGDATNWFPGGAAFVRKQLFNRLGLYDDQIFVSLEDYELAIRGIREGNPVNAKLLNDIVLVHDHKCITLDNDRNAVLVRYDIRSLGKSYEHIKVKHNVRFRHDWIMKLFFIIEASRMTSKNSVFRKLTAYAVCKVFAIRSRSLGFFKYFFLFI